MAKLASQQATTIDVDGLPVTITRKRVKNLNLRIKPDGSVWVSVSPRVTTDQITSFVRSRRDWIERARQKMAQRSATQELCCDEESTVVVWGQSLTCHVVASESAQRAKSCTFTVEGDRLCVSCGHEAAHDNAEASELRTKALREWLNQQLRAEAMRLMPSCEALVGAHHRRLRFRRMTSRWGSCNTQNASITLNTELVHYPPTCLRYVIIHELCHLHVPNHGPQFHQLMDRFCPDWQDIRAVLNSR